MTFYLVPPKMTWVSSRGTTITRRKTVLVPVEMTWASNWFISSLYAIIVLIPGEIIRALNTQQY